MKGLLTERSVGSAGASVLRSCIAAIVASRRGRDPAGEECRGTPIYTARTIESDKGDKGASHLARAGLEPSLSLPTTVCVSRASSTSSSWSSRRSRSPQPPAGRMVTGFPAFHPFAPSHLPSCSLWLSLFQSCFHLLSFDYTFFSLHCTHMRVQSVDICTRIRHAW